MIPSIGCRFSGSGMCGDSESPVRRAVLRGICSCAEATSNVTGSSASEKASINLMRASRNLRNDGDNSSYSSTALEKIAFRFSINSFTEAGSRVSGTRVALRHLQHQLEYWPDTQRYLRVKRGFAFANHAVIHFKDEYMLIFVGWY
jgi:hypothetical protein